MGTRKITREWLISEIKELIKSAEFLVEEEEKEAEDGYRGDQDKHRRAAEVGRHFAAQLQRILGGKTFMEHMVEMVREAERE